ncbi:MAG: ATPase, partial [Vicinamibacterales bacterium]
MVRCRLLAIALATVALGAPARAEVVESSPLGFGVRNDAVINAAPGVVYAALTEAIGRWWDPAHTFSHDARNLSLDAKPGGCLCERLPGGGGVEHLRVIYASPGKLLRLTGGV